MNEQELQNGLMRFVRKPKAAEILGVSTRTIEREASNGNLKKYKVRGCVCYLLADVLRLGGINPTPS